MVALHLTNCASERSSVCLLPQVCQDGFPKFTEPQASPKCLVGGGKRLEEMGLAWEIGTQYVNEPPWQIHFIMLRESN